MQGTNQMRQVVCLSAELSSSPVRTAAGAVSTEFLRRAVHKPVAPLVGPSLLRLAIYSAYPAVILWFSIDFQQTCCPSASQRKLQTSKTNNMPVFTEESSPEMLLRAAGLLEPPLPRASSPPPKNADRTADGAKHEVVVIGVGGLRFLLEISPRGA
jgi:hypothetical protein